jgi:alpha-ribazole phosphatase
MTELILLRHGKTPLNEKKVYCGRSNPPLSAEGILETEQTAKQLQAFDPDCVYASDKQRTQQSARIVTPHMPVTTVPALHELDFGDFEGLGADEICREMPNEWQAYLDNPYGFHFPSGESVQGFLTRSSEAVRQIAQQHQGQRILIVTHKGVITAALSYYLHGDLSHTFHYDIRPSGYARLKIYHDFCVLTQLYS